MGGCCGGGLLALVPFNDWELEEILCLLNTIQGKRIFDSKDYLMILKETRDDCFSVKLIFKALVW